MPGFPVLTTLQPIVGSDMHKSIPPPPPAGPLMVPHVVVWGSGLSQKTGFMWAIAATSRASSPESGCLHPTTVGMGHACGRTHDAGPHPGHIWPNALLPLVMLGSSSKAEFGSGTVKVAVSPQGGGSLDMGVNVAYALNMNLDCQDFPIPPLPTGLCFTINYNVTAGFGLMDFLRGLIQMLFDSALTWVVSGACALLTAGIGGAIGKIMGKGTFMAIAGAALKGSASLGATVENTAIRSAAGVMNDGAGYFASNGRLFVEGWRFMPAALASAWKAAPADQIVGLIGTAAGTFYAGTPIGYAPEHARVSGYAPDTPASKAGNWINELFR
jgi:hypothetical protein